MTEKIAFDKFRYWLISLDLLEKEPDLKNWENNRFESGIILHRSDGSVCEVKSLAILEDKSKRKEFSAIYIDVSSFLGNKLILTYGELSADSAGKLSTNNINYFKKLREDLFLQSSELFNEENKSIFIHHYYTGAGHRRNIIDAPIVLYMEPLENELFSNSNNDISVDAIRNVIQMFHPTFRTLSL